MKPQALLTIAAIAITGALAPASTQAKPASVKVVTRNL